MKSALYSFLFKLEMDGQPEVCTLDSLGESEILATLGSVPPRTPGGLCAHRAAVGFSGMPLPSRRARVLQAAPGPPDPVHFPVLALNDTCLWPHGTSLLRLLSLQIRDRQGLI